MRVKKPYLNYRESLPLTQNGIVATLREQASAGKSNIGSTLGRGSTLIIRPGGRQEEKGERFSSMKIEQGQPSVSKG
ncbi:MAG: hypothetical protein CVU64_08050 [Deltaproteobacteria bacterium HGW-Deltaproteobacteria-21]|nr:MAG: hypothetical protein CVU64_08050 [Deltaproteobacteria bacterium HGW-Deltaproteobacteria-21]